MALYLRMKSRFLYSQMNYSKVKLPFYDSIDIKSVSDSLHTYPIHYHETFCVSIIERGVFVENEVIAPQGTILLSNPGEIHENSPYSNLSYNLTTFYISPDVFQEPGRILTFSDKVLYDPLLFERLARIASQPDETNAMNLLAQSVNDLFDQHGTLIKRDPVALPTNLTDLLAEIRERFAQKLSIDAMASQCRMSRFQFIRWFRKHAGITPHDFLLLHRVEQGKRMLEAGKSPVHTALDVGFYDQSHFANAFKRYVGVTPGTYQSACTIFQDSEKRQVYFC
ncbi:MAG: AraC family transcriptional regulator [Cytophagales bacterium]|nr:MAG: AraC family transcriptional regulator [Cytophagales bacterium]